MKTKHQKGKSFSVFLYICGIIVLTILTWAMNTTTPTLRLVITLGASLCAVVMIFSVNRVSDGVFSIIQSVCFTFLAMGMSHTFLSSSIFFCIIIMEIVLSSMLINSRFMRIHFILVLAFLIINQMVSCFLAHSIDTTSGFIASSLGVLGIHWLCNSMVLENERRERINAEFQRSQEELVWLIDAKCDEAKEATRSKSDFLSNMSHEIRTPLNSILAMNELVLRETNDDTIREYAAISESSGKLLLSLINDILDFSKIESGKMRIIPANYRLSALLIDNIRMLESRFSDKGLRLSINVSEDIPDCLIGDEMRIRQILTNLLTNAAKYTDKGSVTLTVTHSETESGIDLMVSVKDTGRGIRESDKKNLFTKFIRVDERSNRGIEGTGLGLSITAKLIDAMHGSITVDSEYGAGSDFRFTIPQKVWGEGKVGDFARLLSEKRAAVKKSRASFTAPEARILVTDDTPSNLRVVQGLLKRTKMQIDTAASGAECIAMLLQNSYDVILLDHMMPEMDGVETLKEIKRRGLAKEAPIVALTANTVSGAAERYSEYGFDAYLAKPVSGSELEECLLKLLPKKLVQLTAEEAEEPKENERVELPEENSETDITFIDLDIGMKYCGGMPELYDDILATYCDQSEKLLSTLEKCFCSHDIENYRITSHTIKSTSLTIGAKAFSEEALYHETAARNEDFAAIEQGYDKFAADFSAVIEKAKLLMFERKNGNE